MQENKSGKNKRKFNYILMLEIIGIIVFCACMTSAIYQVVVYQHADEWYLLFSFVIASLLIIVFFKNTFIFSKKALRNRILLYAGLLLALCLPNMIGELVEYGLSNYETLPDVAKMINDYGFGLQQICAINCLANILAFAFMGTVLAFLIEMILKDNLKKEDVINK